MHLPLMIFGINFFVLCRWTTEIHAHERPQRFPARADQQHGISPQGLSGVSIITYPPNCGSDERNLIALFVARHLISFHRETVSFLLQNEVRPHLRGRRSGYRGLADTQRRLLRRPQKWVEAHGCVETGLRPSIVTSAIELIVVTNLGNNFILIPSRLVKNSNIIASFIPYQVLRALTLIWWPCQPPPQSYPVLPGNRVSTEDASKSTLSKDPESWDDTRGIWYES